MSLDGKIIFTAVLIALAGIGFLVFGDSILLSVSSPPTDLVGPWASISNFLVDLGTNAGTGLLILGIFVIIGAPAYLYINR